MWSGMGSSAPTISTEKDKIHQVIVNGIRGEKVTVDLCNTEEQMRSMTVRQLKEKITQKLRYTAAAEPRSANTSSPATTSGRMGKIYKVMVNGIRGEKVTVDLCNTEEQMKSITVLQLKEKIAQKLPETGGLDNVRLIFTDKPLDDDSRFLSKYGIKHMSVIHAVIKIPGGGVIRCQRMMVKRVTRRTSTV